METIKVGIYKDKDGFAQALAKGLARESRAMNFRILSSIGEGEDCQLILSTERVKDHRLVYLSATQGQDIQIDQPPFQLYRYEDCQTMVNHLLLIHFSITGQVMDGGLHRACKLLMITAECGGAGATSLAISLGKELYTLYGYESLYLNLCPINDGAKYFPTPQINHTIKLLYYLDVGKTFPLEPFISSADNLDYISNDIVNRHLHDLSADILEKLFDAIDQLGKYQYVIVDVGNHLSRENMKLLERAKYTIFLRHSKMESPPEIRVTILNEVKKTAIIDSVITVENFVDDQWECQEGQDFCLEDKPETFYFDERGVLQIKLNHGYGIGVTAIAKRIAEEVGESG